MNLHVSSSFHDFRMVCGQSWCIRADTLSNNAWYEWQISSNCGWRRTYSMGYSVPPVRDQTCSPRQVSVRQTRLPGGPPPLSWLEEVESGWNGGSWYQYQYQSPSADRRQMLMHIAQLKRKPYDLRYWIYSHSKITVQSIFVMVCAR